MNDADSGAERNETIGDFPDLDDPQKILGLIAREEKLLACDLHDDLMQLLVGSKMQLESILLQKDELSNRSRNKITEVTTSLDRSVAQLRDLIRTLASARVERGFLPGELEQLVANEKTDDLEIVFDLDAALMDADPLQGGSVYRIVKEAVHNAKKHAAADKIFVGVQKKASDWRIVVLDNGRGLGVNDVGDNTGLGLNGIRARASIFNGKFRITSSRMDPGSFAKMVSSVTSESGESGSGTLFTSGTCVEVVFPAV